MSGRAQPDYNKAAALAINALRSYPGGAVPIDLNLICRVYDNLRLDFYSSLAGISGASEKNVAELLGSPFGACVKDKNGRYIIYLNDLMANAGSVRFTCAHELGHFLLGHIESLGGPSYETGEKEANCFARNLLAPHILVKRLMPRGLAFSGKEAKAAWISRAFSVSVSAAETRLDFMDTDARALAGLDLSFLDGFKLSMTETCAGCGGAKERGAVCGKCAELAAGEAGDSRCPMCGAALGLNAPNCGVCGFPAINVCVNPDCAGITARGDRRCPRCGAETAYAALGLDTGAAPYTADFGGQL